MGMLHTVNKSPFERNSLESCLGHALDGSAILLYEDGIYAAIRGSRVAERIKGATSNHSVYVLGPDLKARGLKEDQVVDGITIVDYAGFVDLVAQCDKVQSWL
jgi:tRNA 2-thiouridine synthesizing protein B